MTIDELQKLSDLELENLKRMVSAVIISRKIGAEIVIDKPKMLRYQGGEPFQAILREQAVVLSRRGAIIANENLHISRMDELGHMNLKDAIRLDKPSTISPIRKNPKKK